LNNWDEVTDCDFSELDGLEIDWSEYDAD